MSHSKPPIWKRLLRLGAVVLALLLIAYFLILPAAFGVVATRPAGTAVGSAPAGFQTLSLTTEDAVQLAAWYAPPQNSAAIIVLHGAGGSREGMRPVAEMLVRRGYGVLALDQRGHGQSGGATNQFGWAGSRDVGAAVRYLEQQPDVKAIGAIGSSLGGEVLLGAASTFPALKAIVSDGASYRTLREFEALPEHQSVLVSLPTRVMDWTVRLITGEAPPEPPLLDSMLAADQTAFLFIAAGNNKEEAAFNAHFAAVLAERATLWIAPEVDHTGAFSRYPDEYEQRVIGFFGDYLS